MDFIEQDGRKRSGSTDVSSNPFLPDDDEVVTDITIPEDRASMWISPYRGIHFFFFFFFFLLADSVVFHVSGM